RLHLGARHAPVLQARQGVGGDARRRHLPPGAGRAGPGPLIAWSRSVRPAEARADRIAPRQSFSNCSTFRTKMVAPPTWTSTGKGMNISPGSTIGGIGVR